MNRHSVAEAFVDFRKASTQSPTQNWFPNCLSWV